MKLLKDIKISQRTKDFLKGLGAILLIVIFTGASISVVNSYNQKAMDEVNAEADKRQLVLAGKIDSARLADAETRAEIRVVQNYVKEIDANQVNLQKSVNSNFNQLKQIQKDEKIYIPAATAREQLDFISNYRYTPVE